VRILLAVTTVALGLVSGAAASSAQTYAVGVVPQERATVQTVRWTPLLEELNRRTGLSLSLAATGDMPVFERTLSEGGYDIAYMNPQQYVVVHDGVGYRAFAHEVDRPLVGVIVVHRDSPFRTLADLSGRRVAFPSSAAFAASMLTQAEFARQQIPIVGIYLQTHDDVYRSVASGTFSAGGGITRTLEASEPAVRDRLRILAATGGVSPHPFAAHPRVPTAVVERLTKALVELSQDPKGRAVLAPLAMTGLQPAQDADWNGVRALLKTSR
jgi:phosphonate transport system substrate-binding protein